jgi:hypothetical protein
MPRSRMRERWYRSKFYLLRHQLEVNGQLHAPVALTPPLGKRPQFLLNRRVGRPQSRSVQYGEVKILDPTGTQLFGTSLQLNVHYH